MAQNLIFDPVKQDYVLDSKGSSQPSDRVTEACYYALAIPQGRWLYGTPNQGSKLYSLDNVKRTASVEQRIASFVEDAIERQVIATGAATAQSFKNVDATRTGTAGKLEVVPKRTQASTQIFFTVV